jgi:hypothetical protein
VTANSLKGAEFIEIQCKGAAGLWNWWFARISHVQELQSSNSVRITLLFRQFHFSSPFHCATFDYHFNAMENPSEHGYFGGIQHLSVSKIDVWKKIQHMLYI